jgi:hypothetical protein
VLPVGWVIIAVGSRAPVIVERQARVPYLFLRGWALYLLGHHQVPWSLKSAFFHVSAHSLTVPE